MSNPQPIQTSRRGHWIAALVIAIGVASHLGALRWGFLIDDYMHQYMLRGLSGAEHLPWWNLYDFCPPPQSEFTSAWRMGLWWTDPQFKARFFRPVTSVSIALDYWLYGDWAPGYHITSLGLFAIFLWLVWRLLCRLDVGRGAALWALAFIALDDVHTMPVGWIANRNALLAALFAVATVLAALAYQERRRWRHLVLAVLCLLLACGSKESGLAAWPLMALALVAGRPNAPGISLARRAGQTLRSPVLWACGAAVVLFLTVYVLGGYGARSIVYPVPWVDSGVYLLRLMTWLPLASASLFLGSGLDVIAPYPAWIGPFAGGAAIVLLIGGALYIRVVRPDRITWLGVGWILACLVVEAGSDFSDRLLPTATIGAALLFGRFVALLGDWRARLRERQRAVVALAGLLILAGVLAPVSSTIIRGEIFATIMGNDRREIVTAPVDRTQPAPRHVVLLNAPSSLLALSFAPTWAVEHNDRDTWTYPLQLGRRALTIDREDTRTILVTSENEPFADNRVERIFRWRAAPQVGERFECPAFTATITSVEADGIRAARFVFAHPLEDPNYTFLAFTNGRLAPLAMPTVGTPLELPSVPSAAWYVP